MSLVGSQVLGMVRRMKVGSGAFPLGAISAVATRENIASLTFDDGPHPEYTPRLLEILERHGAKATFFMIGEAAQKHPQLVRLVAQAGQAIGNHSWDHPSFHLISSFQRREQIRSCERAIFPYGQRLFRPPFGHRNRALGLEALRLRYRVLTWSLDIQDWRDQDAESMASRLITNLKAGDIVLLHDGMYSTPADQVVQYRREAMLEAIDLSLEQLAGRLTFATIPQLLEIGQPISGTFHLDEMRIG